MYAAGKIPGGVFRREGRPGEPAILTCRLTDRPLRPELPRGLPQRGAGRRHDHGRRPDQPARRAVDQRRVGRAHRVGHPVRRPDRRGAPVASGERVDRPPDVRGERRVHVRARRRRSHDRQWRHRHHDGRGRWHRGHLAPLRRGRAEGDRRGHRRRPRRGQAVDQGVDRAPEEAPHRGHLGPRSDRRHPLRDPHRLRRRRVRRGRRAGHRVAPRRRCPSPTRRRATTVSTRSSRACCSRCAAPPTSPSSTPRVPSRSSRRSASLQKKVVRSRIVNEGLRIDGRGTTDIRPLVGRGRHPADRPRHRPLPAG